MQKTIHGADDIITSSKSSLNKRPPVLQQEDIEATSHSDEDSEPDPDLTTGPSNRNHDGLYWLDGPPPNLDNVERCVFTIEDTIDISSPYLLDLLDSTPPTIATAVRSHPVHRAPVLPPAVRTAPKETDWGIW
jgi:hypothetical protein